MPAHSLSCASANAGTAVETAGPSAWTADAAWAPDAAGPAAQEIAGWIADGSLLVREEVIDGGVAAFGATLMRLFKGENTGKLVLRIGAGEAS